MNKYLLCNKATGAPILELYGEDFQHSDTGMNNYITDGVEADSRILYCWSHDTYLVRVEYDVEISEEKEIVIFKRKGE